MEAEHQDLAIKRIELEKSGRDLFAVFDVRHTVKGTGLVVGNFECERTIIVAAAVKEFVEARHGSFTALVDDEIAGDGEEPGFKAGFAVELSTPGKDAHPDFLE